jgi:hypothetical protein
MLGGQALPHNARTRLVEGRYITGWRRRLTVLWTERSLGPRQALKGVSRHQEHEFAALRETGGALNSLRILPAVLLRAR